MGGAQTLRVVPLRWWYQSLLTTGVVVEFLTTTQVVFPRLFLMKGLMSRRSGFLSLQERGGRRGSPQHSGRLHLLPLQRLVCRHFSGGILPDRTQRHQQEVGPPAASLPSSPILGRGLHVRVSLIRRFYSRDIRASGILNGDVEPPHECYDLYHILEEYTEAYTADWTSKNMRPKVAEAVVSLNGRAPADRWLSFVLRLVPPVFWSIQTSSSSSAETISQLQAATGQR